MRPNPQETADLVTFTEEIRNGKLHFLCGVFFSGKTKLVTHPPLFLSKFELKLASAQIHLYLR